MANRSNQDDNYMPNDEPLIQPHPDPDRYSVLHHGLVMHALTEYTSYVKAGYLKLGRSKMASKEGQVINFSAPPQSLPGPLLIPGSRACWTCTLNLLRRADAPHIWLLLLGCTARWSNNCRIFSLQEGADVSEAILRAVGYLLRRIDAAPDGDGE